MRTDEFAYDLPQDLIAQEPRGERDNSRLMVIDRRAAEQGSPFHTRFRDLPEHLKAGDLLVLNDTRVLPARLRGRRATPGASARVEVLLVERLSSSGPTGSEIWKVMAKGVKRPGDMVDFGSGLLGHAGERVDEHFTTMELTARGAQGCLQESGVEDLLAAKGVMPLPPYIHRTSTASGDPRDAMDAERYQTVIARAPGAIAAPTAGLHFTRLLLENLMARGVRVATLTLHVGPGTFLPVKTVNIETHRLLPERFEIPEATTRAIDMTREAGGRVVAVGTTVTRALESAAQAQGRVRAGAGSTDLFIHPGSAHPGSAPAGYAFRVVDGLITNFHLPRSTLLMLVSAFAGRDVILSAYEEAVRLRYRFYSYGDAMLIL